MNTLFIVVVCAILCGHWAVAEDELEEELETGTYQVFRVTALNELQLQYLKGLWKNASEYHIDFWKPPRNIGLHVDIMVPPSMQEFMTRAFRLRGIQFTVTVEDVQKLMQNERKIPKETEEETRFKRDSRVYYDFRQYHSYDTMRQYMRSVQAAYPRMAQVLTLGYTHEQRPIDAIKIGTNAGKPAIWIDGGIHAREWPASHVAMYFIHQLVSQYDTDAHIKFLVDNLNWFILPLANPDGYEYSRSSDNPSIRMWRKNRSPAVCFQSPGARQQRCCRGVDVNRNFDFHFGGESTSDQPCNEVYKGTAPFSEPESKAIRDAILRYKNQLEGMITIHTYSQAWVMPYGHARGQYAPNHNEMQSVAEKATRALEENYGTSYETGTSADVIYPAGGGSDDWAKNLGIRFVYLIELRPDMSVEDGFILDTSLLPQTCKETWDGIKVMADEVLKKKGVRLPEFPDTTASGNERGPDGDGPGNGLRCVDHRVECRNWIRNNPNFCYVVPDFMQDMCPRSCNLC